MQNAAFSSRPAWWRHRNFTQMLLVMKLLIVLLTTTFLQVRATGVSQSITLSGKNLDMKEVFSAIKKQTGFVAFSKKGLLEEASRVSVSVQGMPLADFLELVSKDQPFTYLIVGKTISLSRRAAPEALPAPVAVAPPVLADPTHPLSGRVLDADGKPLADATVAIKKTKTYTSTRADGLFTLNVHEGDVLVITFVGYTSREIKVTADLFDRKEGNVLPIALSRSTNELDQVQVTAYGTTTKRLNPGDITTITAEEIEKSPVSNVLEAIQGKVPGLFIQQTTGQPGGAFTLQVRDAEDIANGAIAPLIIVDGVRYPGSTLPLFGSTDVGLGTGSTLQGGNGLNYINPQDIASIDVLKDADATAIYGSAGAYGVILITTKKAQAGAPTLNANVYTGVSIKGEEPKLMNTQQYVMLREEALKNDGLTAGSGDLDVNGTWPTDRSTNWRNVYLGSSAQTTSTNLSYSGGSKYTSYMVNGSYTDNGNIQRHKGDFQNGSMRVSLSTTTADNKFNLALTGGYMASKNDMVPYDFSLSTALDAPNAPSPFLPNGQINWADDDENGPGTAANINRTYNNVTNNFLANGTLVYKPVRGLTLRTILGYNDLTGKELIGYPTTTMAPTNTNAAQQTQGVYNFFDNRSLSISPYAEYDRLLWGKGNLNLKAGGEIDNENAYSTNIVGKGFASDALLTDPAAATSVTSTYSQTPYRALGFYGIIKYVWDQKYILDLNGRRDGSTKFGEDNRFGNFGSVAAAWIFSDEKFMKENLPFLSFGKLRGSTGIVGGDAIPSYAYLSTYTANQTAYNGKLGLSPGGPADPNLSWEKNHDSEIGLDLGFLKDRVLLSGDYYHNESSNQLVTRPVSYITGFGTYSLNSDAVVRTSGWEGTLSTINIRTRDFTWTTHLNISIPTSKLIKAPSLANQDFNYVVGKPLTGKLLYKYAGVDPETGFFQFTNAKGSTQDFDYLSGLTQADMTQFVDMAPKFFGGITNSFTYKQFSLDVFVNVTDRMGYNELAQSGYLFGMFDVNGSTDWLRRWQKPGDKTDMPKVSTNIINDVFRMWTYQTSTGAYTNATYARLQNVSFRYHFSKHLLSKSHLHDVTLYLQGQNLLTVSKFGGLDPENLNAGVIPPLRVFTGGINLTL